MICRACNQPIEKGSTSCPFCGAAVQTARPRIRPLPIFLSIVAGVLVVAIVVGLLTNWYGLYGPTARILIAAKQTLESDSFTVTLTKGSKAFIYEVAIDFESRNLTVICRNQDDQIVSAIYKGLRIKYNKHAQRYDARDASTDVAKFFDCYENLDNWDFTGFFQLLTEDSDFSIETLFDSSELKGCLVDLYFDANSDGWLTENMGFSEKCENGVTVFTFQPDFYQLLNTVGDDFEDAFQEESKHEKLMNALTKREASLRKVKASLSVGIQGGALVSVEIGYGLKEITKTIQMEVSNVGRTDLDTAALDVILETAKMR